ncbi:DUF5662 family protein [Anaerolentibacter hominis]|uniref:DUF5662 family protein n=1 Tax=Anaerolentibacter hominis TaxID=3079009 RepID=UPI0031B7FA9C
MKALQHFKTITKHRNLVMKECFKVGLYKQGLLHDLSKYSYTEFSVGCKYFQGNRSPNNAEREDKGYSSAWLHHKGRNKHHYEYWIDYSISDKGGMSGMEMPIPYVVEMVMDRIAASRIYNGKAYRDTDPLNYYKRGRDYSMLNPKTRALLEQMLVMLAEQGEDALFSYIKTTLLPEYRREKARQKAAKRRRTAK